jgi:glycosyltransferase involved in cell wall biosynthesis
MSAHDAGVHAAARADPGTGAVAEPVVHMVVPDWIDDPTRPSGGNTYDRRVVTGLAARGLDVRLHSVAGDWPSPTAADLGHLATVLDGIADAATILIDGLIGCAAPSVLVPRSGRLGPVVLVHLPLGLDLQPATGEAGPGVRADAERSVLIAASAVITTSQWTSEWLLDRYELDATRIDVGLPGVDPAEPATPDPGGLRLLCVGAVTPIKGHDVLLTALAGLRDRPWHLTCVGSRMPAPEFAARVRSLAAEAGIADRIRWSGPLTGRQLTDAYAAADVLLLPSRMETYGLVATEALARGLPVLGSAVGGLPEALGAAADGARPGLLVPAGDPAALGAAIRRWLTEPALRRELRSAAATRRGHLRTWAATAEDVAAALIRARRRSAVMSR